MEIDLGWLCLTDAEGLSFRHDPILVTLSYLLATAGSFATIDMIGRWQAATGTARRKWQAVASITLGGSVWSMHFLATLALEIEFPLTYALEPTLASFFLVVAACFAGLEIMGRWPGVLMLASAGIMIGLGVAAMHYVGMSGLHFGGTIGYRPFWWGLSLLVAIVVATVALILSTSVQTMKARLAAALVMAAAVCGMHYTGMAGTVLRLDPLAPMIDGISRGPLAAAVTVAAIAVILAALALAAADRRLLAAAVRENEHLRDANLQLEATNHALNLGRQQLNAVLDSMIQGVCLFDDVGRLAVYNRRYTEIYGLPPDIDRVGRTLREIITERDAVGSGSEIDIEEYLAWRIRISDERRIRDSVVHLKNGRIISIRHQPLPAGGWVATHEDITEQQEAQASILFMARHDALTRLPNRTMFSERLQEALALDGHAAGCAVHCLDLDHFKIINDTLGHPVGDGLLQAVADRLKGCVRDMDTVARLGGDEFAVVQRSVRHADEARALAARVIAALATPYEVQGHQITVEASIGIAQAPHDGATAEDLLKRADIALYAAKSEKRGTVRFFEPEMDASLRLRRTMEMDLRSALSRRELEVHYQPLVEVASGEIAGFEALVRWRHPDCGLVPPGEFIPLAEETGMIVEIGEWVLKTACMEAQTWPRSIGLAANLSPVQFQKGDIIRSVQDALDLSGLAPDRLELEITESVLLHQSSHTLRALHRLREIGIRIALDDFGTGYSSLSYLRSFPFDKIKIDQSFVRDLLKSPGALAIVRAVTGLAQSLEMTTVAEGVETDEQLERLRAEGCTEVQGYLLSRPAPSEVPPVLTGHWR